MQNAKKKLKLKDISLIIYDFDGIMTDNRVFLFADGREAVFVNRSDGLAVKVIKKKGVSQLIVSSESNPVVKIRARKLGIPAINSVKNKKEAVERYLKTRKISSKKVVFIGNDINDKEVMKYVNWPIAPIDAHIEIKKIAKIVLLTKGGSGVIREFLDKLI